MAIRSDTVSTTGKETAHGEGAGMRSALVGLVGLMVWAVGTPAAGQELIPVPPPGHGPVLIYTRCGPTPRGIAPGLRAVARLFSYYPRWNCFHWRPAPRNPEIYQFFLDNCSDGRRCPSP
ncbi:MAG: hypothetical protein NZ700_12065 [Gemmataceae bacterium]|nr:hypothetical protein [Gemmataceae bacterium]MDW8266690.1 hypothetical protein [Gemmataceae bacterium]